jgi:flavin reductase (DIM6/NTAB) family NADH-FMN oxidoreductase RutF
MPLPSPVLVPALTAVSADPAHVRGEMGRFPSGVAALCAIVDGVRVGMVATSFSVGVSYSPPMVMFSVQNSSTTWPVLSRSPRIGISILGQTQSAACMQLASRGGDRFAGLASTETEGGALLLDDAAMWLECEVVNTTPAGDHRIVVLEVHKIGSSPEGDPLVYHRRAFRGLAELQIAG